MDTGLPLLLALGVLGLVALGVFLLFRAFWLWYWRIDAIVSQLEGIREGIALLNAREAGRDGARGFAATGSTRATGTVPPSPQAAGRRAPAPVP